MRKIPQGSACLYVFIKLLQHEKDLLTKRRNTGLYVCMSVCLSVCLSVNRLYTTCASFVKIFFVNFNIIFPAIYCIISHKFCQYFFVFLLFFCRSRAAAIHYIMEDKRFRPSGGFVFWWKRGGSILAGSSPARSSRL